MVVDNSYITKFTNTDSIDCQTVGSLYNINDNEEKIYIYMFGNSVLKT